MCPAMEYTFLSAFEQSMQASRMTGSLDTRPRVKKSADEQRLRAN